MKSIKSIFAFRQRVKIQRTPFSQCRYLSSSTTTKGNSPPPFPKLVTIDAYETIYTPRPSIPQQYSRILQECGIQNISAKMIEDQFPTIFKRYCLEYPNYGKTRGISVDRFWYLFLRGLLKSFGNADKDENRMDNAIKTIIFRLSQREAYEIHDDVLPFLRELDACNIHKCIASNADSKVTNLIIEQFELPFHDRRDIYLSYDLEVLKPDPRFFQRIIDDYCHLKDDGVSRDEVIPFAWHVGDEFNKDIEGALETGMNGVLIDRDDMYGYLGNKDKNRDSDDITRVVKVKEGFYVIADLRDFFEIFQCSQT